MSMIPHAWTEQDLAPGFKCAHTIVLPWRNIPHLPTLTPSLEIPILFLFCSLFKLLSVDLEFCSRVFSCPVTGLCRTRFTRAPSTASPTMVAGLQEIRVATELVHHAVSSCYLVSTMNARALDPSPLTMIPIRGRKTPDPSTVDLMHTNIYRTTALHLVTLHYFAYRLVPHRDLPQGCRPHPYHIIREAEHLEQHQVTQELHTREMFPHTSTTAHER